MKYWKRNALRYMVVTLNTTYFIDSQYSQLSLALSSQLSSAQLYSYTGYMVKHRFKIKCHNYLHTLILICMCMCVCIYMYINIHIKLGYKSNVMFKKRQKKNFFFFFVLQIQRQFIQASLPLYICLGKQKKKKLCFFFFLNLKIKNVLQSKQSDKLKI